MIGRTKRIKQGDVSGGTGVRKGVLLEKWPLEDDQEGVGHRDIWGRF